MAVRRTLGAPDREPSSAGHGRSLDLEYVTPSDDLGAWSQEPQVPLSRRLRRVALHRSHRRRATDVRGLGERVRPPRYIFIKHFKVPVISVVRSRRALHQKAGSTSNSITYPHSKAASTLVSFVTGSSYGPAYTPLT